jgi:hypothetical protein
LLKPPSDADMTEIQPFRAFGYDTNLCRSIKSSGSPTTRSSWR